MAVWVRVPISLYEVCCRRREGLVCCLRRASEFFTGFRTLFSFMSFAETFETFAETFAETFDDGIIGSCTGVREPDEKVFQIEGFE